MNVIRFFAAGTPKPQPRPRAFSRNGMVRVYDPGSAEGWKSAIAVAARGSIPASPIDEPVRLDIEYCLPRPKGHFGKRGLRGKAPAHPCSKPDLDNLDKAVMDALSELGVWRDDSLVCEKNTSKRYGMRAGALVTISEIEPLSERAEQ